MEQTCESFEELSKKFPTRTLRAVTSKFYELGLKRTPPTTEETKPIEPLFLRVQKNCTTSLLHLLNEIQLVQHSCTTNLKKQDTLNRDIVQDLCTLISNKRWPITQYYLTYGAATAWTIRFRLSAKKRTVYEAIEQLRSTGLLIDYHQVKNKGTKYKQNSIIWGLPTAKEDQIKEAHILHLRLCSPKYRTAEKIGQTILEEWMAKGLKEIHYRQVMQEIKELKIPFKGIDIADITAQFLHENGITVIKGGLQ